MSQIQFPSGRQLRDLFKVFALQLDPHGIQDFNKTQILVGSLFILVQDIQQGGGTGAARTTGGIRELKVPET